MIEHILHKGSLILPTEKENNKKIIMKREINLLATQSRKSEYSDMARNFWAWAKAPNEWLRKYYSAVLEKEISLSQANIISRAQIAFILSVFTTNDNLLVKAIFVAWFIAAVLRAKKALGE